MKITCSQCNNTNLEKIDFPYKAKLILTKTGLAGETNEYELTQKFYGTAYICPNCGHIEFFNQELAKELREN